MSSTFEVSRKRWWRTLVAGVLAATCVRVWLGPGEILPRAVAQIPDSGLQRKKMVDELQHTNRLLEQINQTLLTQTIKVQVAGTDKTKDRVFAPRAKNP